MAHMSLKTVKEGPRISTKSALRADLDAEDRKTLAEDRKRMERLGGGGPASQSKTQRLYFAPEWRMHLDEEGRLADFFAIQRAALDHGASGGVADRDRRGFRAELCD